MTIQEPLARGLTVQDTLEPGEPVKEIQVPKLEGKIHYDKERARNVIDFVIVSLASCLEIGNHVIRGARIVFGGVAPIPYRMPEVKEFLRGKGVTEEMAEEVVALTVRDAVPIGRDEYKLFMIEELLVNAVLKADNR